MVDHLNYARKMASMPLHMLQSDIKRRSSILTTTEQPTVIDLREEVIKMAGKSLKVRRVYIMTSDTKKKYSDVGWILINDIDKCMVCLTRLGIFSIKHHCRACGNVVCTVCSNDEVLVAEINDAGPQRVCRQCFWGQSLVNSSPNRSFGESIMINSRPHTPVEHGTRHCIPDYDLWQYGKVEEHRIVPCFVLRTRTKHRDRCFINVCTCEAIPMNTNLKTTLDGISVYLVVNGAPKHSDERLEKHSIYTVAVSPGIVTLCEKDETKELQQQLCQQILSYLSTVFADTDFSSFQFEHHVPHNFFTLDLKHDVYTNRYVPRNAAAGMLDARDLRMVVPHANAIRRLCQITTRQKDLDPNAPRSRSATPDTETEESKEHFSYASSGLSGGEHRSMVHYIKPVLGSDGIAAAERSHAEASTVANPTASRPPRNPNDVLLPGNVELLKVPRTLKSVTFKPTPGFVIKTSMVPVTGNASSTMPRVGAEDKVFVNVFHHPLVDELLASETVQIIQYEKPLLIFGDSSVVVDHQGQKRTLFNVCTEAEYFRAKYDKAQINVTDGPVIGKIIRAVNVWFRSNLDSVNYSLPKVAQGYKGDEVQLMTFVFYSKSVVLEEKFLKQLQQEDQSLLTQPPQRDSTASKEDQGWSFLKQHHEQVQERLFDKKGDDFNLFEMLHHGPYNPKDDRKAADDDDRRSVVSDVTADWQSVTQEYEAAHAHGHQQSAQQRHSFTAQGSKYSPQARRSTLSFFSGLVAANTGEGRAMLVAHMMEAMRILNLRREDVPLLLLASMKDPRILLGWQIVVPIPKQTKVVMYVITGVRKNSLRKTEFRLSSLYQEDIWVKLKRHETKSGVTFFPTRKVLYLTVNNRIL